MTAGHTPFTHQLRDQAAHIGLIGAPIGAAVGVAGLFGAPEVVTTIAAFAGAGFIGAAREISQWYGLGGMEKLSTPSLSDAVTDASYVAMGGACAALLVAAPWVGLVVTCVTLVAMVAVSAIETIVTGADWY